MNSKVLRAQVRTNVGTWMEKDLVKLLETYI